MILSLQNLDELEDDLDEELIPLDEDWEEYDDEDFDNKYN